MPSSGSCLPPRFRFRFGSVAAFVVVVVVVAATFFLEADWYMHASVHLTKQ